ncbi:MAG: hypothetical protein ABI584_11950 [Acidobacteriota bacterium]
MTDSRSGSPASSAVRRSVRGPVFVHALEEAYGKAAAAAGTRAFTLRIAGRVVRLVFAGSALVAFARDALGSLEMSGGSAPDLTVNLWDTSSTGVPPPSAPWTPDDLRPRGEIRGFSKGPVFASLSLSGGLAAFDETSVRGFFWARDANLLTIHERGAPLLSLFAWFFRAHGVNLVHAAAVGRGRDALLLAGPGGSGKSTTALLCRAFGLEHFADDYALVSGAPRPAVHRLYGTAKLLPSSPAMPGEGDGARLERAGSADGKTLFLLPPTPGGNDASGFALRALVVPRVAGRGETSVSPLPPAEAFRALAPSTVFQLPGAGAASLASLAALVKSVPCFALSLGGDPAQAASAVAGLLPPA